MPRFNSNVGTRPSNFESYMLGRPMAFSGANPTTGNAYAVAASVGRVAVSDTWGQSARSNVYPRLTGGP